MTNSDVWSYWPGFEPYQALMEKPSVLDSSPLKRTLEKQFANAEYKIYHKVVTGAVDIETGETVVTDFDHLADNEYTLGILSSASVPVAFPNTVLRNRRLADPLTSGWNVNMISAIDKCKEIIKDESKI